MTSLRRRLLVPILGVAVLATAHSPTLAGTTSPAKNEQLCKIVMSPEEFWAILDTTTDHNERTQWKLLYNALLQRSPSEIIGFNLALDREADRAKTWDLWGAAYIANGGASDDGFKYFRYWLVSRGLNTFEKVLADPDILADIVPSNRIETLEFEVIQDAPWNAWLKRTGQNTKAFIRELDKYYSCLPRPSEPSGVRPRDLKARFPNLWRRFGASPLG
jgi:hypothetical protein